MTLESRTNHRTKINHHKERSVHNGDLFLLQKNWTIIDEHHKKMTNNKPHNFCLQYPFIHIKLETKCFFPIWDTLNLSNKSKG